MFWWSKRLERSAQAARWMYLLFTLATSPRAHLVKYKVRVTDLPWVEKPACGLSEKRRKSFAHHNSGVSIANICHQIQSRIFNAAVGAPYIFMVLYADQTRIPQLNSPRRGMQVLALARAAPEGVEVIVQSLKNA